MKRKDKKKKGMNVKVVTTAPLVDSIDKDCDCDGACEVCTCKSNGIDPFETIDKNIDTYKVTATLRQFEDGVLPANKKIKNNGWNVGIYDDINDYGLRAKGDTRYAAFIPSSSIGIDYESGDIMDSAALMVNTIDQGPCFVAPNGNSTEPLCPVITPTFIGNASQPYGLYIPFNEKAMKDGMLLTARCLDYIDKNDQNCSRIECMLSAIAPTETVKSLNDKDDEDCDFHIEDVEW